MASGGEQKVVLITGCSSGIGLRIAVLLARDEQKRYHVIATMRDLKKKDRLVEAAGDTYGKTLTLLSLDVCSDDSVRQCIDNVKDRHIDILINNAGVGLLGPVESISMNDMKKVFETNFFGTVRMIKEVMPDMKKRRAGHIIVMSSVMGLQVNNAGVGLLGPVESISMNDMKKVFETNFFGTVRMIKEVMPDMKKRRAGHIIVMSSVMGLQGVVFNDVYTASKFAIEGFCESMAVQLLKFNVKLSLIEPGPVHTEFETKMMEEVAKMEYPGADADTVRYFKDVYIPSSIDIFEALGQTPDDIAKCTKKVIESSRPRFRNLTNSLYTPIVAMKYADETGGLSVHTFYNLLFNFGSLMHITMSILKCLTCSCLRRRTISPD
ncbi:retinol dehydrogenase 8-like protein [Labeo rohita]|uniref:Retinol dehydrogenase 8-like protein n=2 Tax=Labeonini TaxID=2743697 RepID=A0A498LG55_LABRO|nr:retinol dehydrogenase 8-like protein [Labeo rohita]